MKQSVSYDSQGLKLAANIFIPDNAAATKLPAIVVSHPASGVNEQAAGLYAQRLSEAGFVTIAFDAAYGGESEGQPRGLEDPGHRVEDIKNAVSFLANHERVDPTRIGLLGICASGGYATVAAATDVRIKAVATVSGTDLGIFFRKGFDGKQDPSVLQTQLEFAARARTAAAAPNGTMETFPLFPPDEATARQLGQYVYEGWEYYMTPRAAHPRSTKAFPWSSADKIATFKGFEFISQIAPRPYLMILGTKADTKWMGEEAFRNASEPKELYWVEGASHVDLYDKEGPVSTAVERLTGYYRQWLKA